MNYDRFINQRVKDLPKSGIRRFFDIASELDDCISLGVGEPDFVTPWEIRDAAIKSVQAGRTQYTSNAGLLSLREEIALYLNGRFSLSYDPGEEIIVTIGASEAIDLAMRTVVSAGDEVLIPSPCYVSYAPAVLLSGGIPVAVNARAEDGFKLTPSLIEGAVTPRTKAIIMAYPNNPTGAIMTQEELLKIVPSFVKHDLVVVSDEIYAELTYTKERHCSIASLPDMRERTIVVNGFSKAFAMTGWRLGYVAAPKELVSQMYKIHQYTIMCAATCSQAGGEAALRLGRQDGYSSVEDMRASYDVRRRYLTAEFDRMGLTCFKPQGAFYVFPSVKSTGMTGDEFAEKLLYSKHVAVVPGSAFGESGKYFVRCSYATKLSALKEAVARIGEFLKETAR